MDEPYTPIPHHVLEAMYRHGFTKRQHVIMGFICRYTYGFNRDSVVGTLGWISKDTGMLKSHCSEAIKDLEIMRAIPKTGTGVPKTGTVKDISLRINENVAEWRHLPKKPKRSQNGKAPFPKRESDPYIKQTTIKQTKRTTRASLAPDSFPITDQMQKWVVKSFGAIEEKLLVNQTELFLDSHRSKGTKFIKWVSAWQTWIRRWQTNFGRNVKAPPDPNKPRPEDHPNYNGYNPEDYPDG